LNDAFAVVDVGEPDVPVLRENRPAGTTDGGGTLLVPDLVPFTENHFAIDPTTLPVDTHVTRTELTATPFSKVPVLVDLKASTEVRSALIVLHDASDAAIPVGSEVRWNGGQEAVEVGYDGAVFLHDLKDQNSVVVTLPTGGTCAAEFAFTPSPGAQVRIGPVACKPGS
jgi:outer membrane usher protein